MSTYPINNYEQNNEDKPYNLNYVGADTGLNTEGTLLNEMIFPMDNSSQDQIDYRSEDEIEQDIKEKKVRKQEVLPYYEGAKEKLSPLDTVLDAGKGIVEGVADGLVVGSWAGLWCDEDTLNIFETKSAAGDFAHTFTKYLVAGTLALSSGSWTGIALKSAAKLAGKNLLSKSLKNTSKFLLHQKPFVTMAKNPVTDVLFNKLFNPRTLFSGAYADYMAYHPREGHLADILKQNGVDNSFIDWMSGKADDSIAEAKAKNVIEGLILTPLVGIGTDVIAPKIWKNFVGTRNASLKVAKEGTKEAKDELAKQATALNNDLNQVQLIQKTQLALGQSIKNSTDPYEEVRKLVPDFQLDKADFMLEAIQKGETVTPKADNSFAIKIEKWQDGYKVDEEEFSRQLMSGVDEFGNPVSSNQMNKAFKEILEQRGISRLEDESTQSYFNRIINYYKSPDKWNIPNDIKLSFPENIKEKGKTRYGKTRAVRKNGELKNIEIQIKSDAPNKLAVLRAELEHVRDIVSGQIIEKPQGQEFYRYKSKNEEEWQKTYLHKKAISQAIRDEKEIPKDVLKRYKELNKEKNYASYLKVDESAALPKFSKPEQDEIENGLFELLANAAGMERSQLKAMWTNALNGKSDKKLLEIFEKIRTGDYFESMTSVDEQAYLFDKVGFSFNIPKGETGHNAEVIDKIIDELYEKNYTKPAIETISDVGLNNSSIDKQINDGILSKFYEDFFAQSAELNANNVDEFEKIYRNKINQLETLSDSIKEEMYQELEEAVQIVRQQDALEKSVKEVNETVEEFKSANTVDEAQEQLNSLVTSTEIQDPQSAKKLVNSYAQIINTRDYETTLKEIEDIYEYTRKHITDDVLSSGDLSGILNNDGARIQQISNEIIAYEKIQHNIKELLSECNKKLAQNPQDFEQYKKIKTLRDNYTYLEDILINQRSLFGDAFDKLKLGYSKDKNSFDKIYTQKQRKQKDEFVNNLSQTFEEIYEEFYTLNDVPPYDEITKRVLKRLEKKYGEIDSETLDYQNLEHFSKYLDEQIKNNDPQYRSKIIKDAVDLYSQSDELLLFAQGATMANNTAGFSTFKKYFASNLAHNYIGSILSSPATQTANALSGMFNILLEDGMKFLTGFRTGNSELMEDVILTIKGYCKYFGDSIHWASKVFQDEKGIMANTRRYGIELSPFEALEGNPIKPLSSASFGIDENNPFAKTVDYLGGTLRLSSRVMSSVDEFLTQLKYGGEAYKDAYRNAQQGASNLVNLDELDVLADQIFRQEGRYFNDSGGALNHKMLYQARKLLYQNNLERKMYNPETFRFEQMEDKTVISEIGSAVAKIRDLHPGIRFIIPFVNTPFNIIEQLSEYTPASMLTNKYKNLSGVEKQLANTKILFGSASILLTAAMTMNGKITGSAPTDPAERKALTQSGWQPYSFVITNPDGTKKYVSYKRIEPLASILGVGADSMNLINEFKMSDKDITKTTALMGMMILNNALDKSYTRQSLDTLSILSIANEEDANKLQRVMGNFVSGNIPFSAAANWYKNDGVVKEMRTFLDIVQQRNPFVTNEGIMPNRNYFGELRHTSSRGKGLITRETYQRNDSADQEILRLASLGYEPYRPAKQLGDAELDMTIFKAPNKQSAYDKVLEDMGAITIRGKTLREAVNDLVESPRYQNLPDGILEDEDQLYKTKKREINKLIKKYADKAKQNVLNSAEYVNEQSIDLKTMRSNWKNSKRLSRVIDINNELNEIF